MTAEFRPRLAALLLAALLGARVPAVASPAPASPDLMGAASAAFRAGRVAAAIDLWTQAIADAAGIGDRSGEAEALARRGEAWRGEGRLDEAVADLIAALSLSTATGNARLTAAATAELGAVALLGRWSSIAPSLADRLFSGPPNPSAQGAGNRPSVVLAASAEFLLQRGVDEASALGSPDLVAASGNDLGSLYAATGQPLLAAKAYAAAMAAAERGGDARRFAAIATNAARLAARRGDAAGAAGAMRVVLARLAALPPDRVTAQAYVDLGVIGSGSDAHPPPELARAADTALARAVAIADRSGDAGLRSLALGSLGRLAEQTGDLPRAAELTKLALGLATAPDWADQSFRADLSFRWDWQLARVLRAQGHEAEAFAAYRRAVEKIQAIRQDIPIEYTDGRSSFLATFRPLYQDYIDLLLQRADHPGPGETQAGLLREARRRVEELRPLELKDYFRDHCNVDFAAGSGVGDSVPPGVAIVTPIVLGDRVETLVSIANPARRGSDDATLEFHFPKAVREGDLSAEIERFRDGLRASMRLDYIDPAKILSGWLVEPMLPTLRRLGVDTLVVVPDRVLRTVPFAALYVGETFLVEHYAVAVEPALGLIVRRPHTLGGRTLVAGLSSATAAGAGLRNVAGEVRDVADRRGATQLLDADFTHAAFLRELGDPTYTVVHIASHAHFDVDAENTKITAIDTPLSPDEMGEAIRGARKEGLELLVLSACDTAASDTDRAVLGLAGLAVQSGARSALGTLWRANDQAASALMGEFYKALPSASSKAAALQTAQLALLKRPLYRHPNEWSPFMILGDWQ